jgi:hypothetical protein
MKSVLFVLVGNNGKQCSAEREGLGCRWVCCRKQTEVSGCNPGVFCVGTADQIGMSVRDVVGVDDCCSPHHDM